MTLTATMYHDKLHGVFKYKAILFSTIRWNKNVIAKCNYDFTIWIHKTQAIWKSNFIYAHLQENK